VHVYTCTYPRVRRHRVFRCLFFFSGVHCFVSPCTWAYFRSCIHTHIHMLYEHVHICMCMNRCTFVRAYPHIWWYIFGDTCLLSFVHTPIYGGIYLGIHASFRSCIPPYTAHVHTHTHTNHTYIIHNSYVHHFEFIRTSF